MPKKIPLRRDVCSAYSFVGFVQWARLDSAAQGQPYTVFRIRGPSSQTRAAGSSRQPPKTLTRSMIYFTLGRREKDAYGE